MLISFSNTDVFFAPGMCNGNLLFSVSLNWNAICCVKYLIAHFLKFSGNVNWLLFHFSLQENNTQQMFLSNFVNVEEEYLQSFHSNDGFLWFCVFTEYPGAGPEGTPQRIRETDEGDEQNMGAEAEGNRGSTPGA